MKHCCEDGEQDESDAPRLNASGSKSQSMFTHLVFRVPALQIANSTEVRSPRSVSFSPLKSDHDVESHHAVCDRSDSLHSVTSVASPRISAQPHCIHQGKIRHSFKEDMSAHEKSSGSKHSSTSGANIHNALNIQARCLPDPSLAQDVCVCGPMYDLHQA
jgi:hypothetical protein